MKLLKAAHAWVLRDVLTFFFFLQENFKNEKKIATLDCGHEYHAECLEKWLIVKNLCPICKSEALAMEKRNVE